MRQKYWMGIFANRLEVELDQGDLEAHLDDHQNRRTIARKAYVSVQRLAIRGVARRARSMIERLVAEAPDEQWNPCAEWNPVGGDYVVFAWDSPDKRTLPVGFTTFSVSIIDGEECRIAWTQDPICDIRLDHEFVFVRPDRRGAGFGLYLSRGIVEWTWACRVRPPRCPAAGVTILYSADIINEGGMHCARVLIDHFEYLQDCSRDKDLSPRQRWLVVEFVDDSDFEYWIAGDPLGFDGRDDLPVTEGSSSS